MSRATRARLGPVVAARSADHLPRRLRGGRLRTSARAAGGGIAVRCAGAEARVARRLGGATHGTELGRDATGGATTRRRVAVGDAGVVAADHATGEGVATGRPAARGRIAVRDAGRIAGALATCRRTATGRPAARGRIVVDDTRLIATGLAQAGLVTARGPAAGGRIVVGDAHRVAASLTARGLIAACGSTARRRIVVVDADAVARTLRGGGSGAAGRMAARARIVVRRAQCVAADPVADRTRRPAARCRCPIRDAGLPAAVDRAATCRIDRLARAVRVAAACRLARRRAVAGTFSSAVRIACAAGFARRRRVAGATADLLATRRTRVALKARVACSATRAGAAKGPDGAI